MWHVADLIMAVQKDYIQSIPIKDIKIKVAMWIYVLKTSMEGY